MSSVFLESPRFPIDISYGSSGGPVYSTDVIEVSSGHEIRNQNWSQSRHEYDAAMGVVSEPYLSTLISFFHVMAGQTNGFRYKDWGDYLSCDLKATPASNDQLLGVGDSTDGTDGTSTYQIIKSYTQGTITTERKIFKPISGTVLVEVNSILQGESTDYTIDYTTGVITFIAGSVPLAGENVNCGYEFDVPCRFGSDKLNINFNAYSVGDVSVPVKEIRTDDA